MVATLQLSLLQITLGYVSPGNYKRLFLFVCLFAPQSPSQEVLKLTVQVRIALTSAFPASASGILELQA